MKTQLRTHLSSLILFIGFIAGAQDQVFNAEDINRLTSISNVSISPDGETILFMTSNRNMETNSFDRALILLDIESRQQTIIAKDFNGVSAPSWNSDGTISFIGRSEGLGQVYVWNVEEGESKKITESETSINRYAWSPDGKRLAYFSRDVEPEWKNENEFNDAFKVGSNDFLVDESPMGMSVWLTDASGSGERITPGGFTVATGLSTSSLSWSSDSKMLAFTKFPSAFSGDSDLGTNHVYEVESKELRQVTNNTQRESGPSFSRDGKSLIYSYPRDGHPSNMREYHMADLASGKSSNLTKQLDRAASGLTWLEDGTMLMRVIDVWGNFIVQWKNEKSKRVNTGDLVSINSFSISSSGSMVLEALGKNQAEEIYYKSDLKADPVQLTEFNSFLSEINLGQQEGMEWESSDGLKPTGIVTYPPNFDPSKKYPLVLLIHGGPSASSLLGFSPLTQAIAAKGWIVFQPNYRGSTNLGNQFQSAISKDPSEGPGHDVITGVNVLKEKAYVDTDRIGVSGWSYGGWMTSWLIGRYPEVWSAAVAGAAPVDWTDMYSLNDLNRMRRHSIVESPYVGDNLQWAYDNSPISNFSKIKAPTLIMSKTGDYRVTITGSYKLYGALRDNDIPVEFIAYPGPGHFPSDPVRSLDVYTRWIGWLEDYLGSQDEMNATLPDR